MSSGRIPSVEGGIQPTIVDAKGDLIVATAADTVSRLAVGTNDYVLTADSSTSTGLKWAAAAAGGGKVLQVVQNTSDTDTTITSTTYTDTNLSATITPSATSSKVLIIYAQEYYFESNSTALGGAIKLLRGSTDILAPSGTAHLYATGFGSLPRLAGLYTSVYLDSPSTTSATTYKTQFNSPNNVGTVYVQNGGTSTIVLLEIGA